MGIGAVLCQADPNDRRASQAEEAEVRGDECTFEKTLANTPFRLWPIAFISRCCEEREKSYHLFTGKACARDWAMKKFRRFLFGKPFTWISDCSSLRQFFETKDLPTHVHQRWKYNMLRYQFTIVHCPARMLTDCDMLSRYNVNPEVLRARRHNKPLTSVPVAFALPLDMPLTSWPI
jgi:hypothetical protein